MGLSSSKTLTLQDLRHEFESIIIINQGNFSLYGNIVKNAKKVLQFLNPTITLEKLCKIQNMYIPIMLSDPVKSKYTDTHLRKASVIITVLTREKCENELREENKKYKEENKKYKEENDRYKKEIQRLQEEVHIL